jgi:Ras-related protein Rab-28
MADDELAVCKLILLGNGSVGKTSICNRFKDDGFQRVYRQTIGIDFMEKRLAVRGRTLVLQVWDIGGQSISSGMLGQYIWGASVVFLCYDVTDPQSFADAEDWHAMVQRTLAAGAPPTTAAAVANGISLTRKPGRKPLAFLVGNKADLVHLRKVTPEAHDAFISSRRLDGGFFISARSGDNVLTAFYKAAAAHLGVELTQAELAATEKVLGVTVAASRDGEEERRTAMADAIEQEDAAAEARKRGRGACCSLQ